MKEKNQPRTYLHHKSGGKELLKQFKQVEQLSPEDKNLIKSFIDAFLTKRPIQQLAHKDKAATIHVAAALLLNLLFI